MKNKQMLVQLLKAVDSESLVVRGVVGSNGMVDRHGESINPMGWKLENYLNNPVVLWGHDYRALPIGKAVKVWIENEQLMFDIQMSKTYDMGKKVYDLIQEGIVNTVSVGFIPLKLDETGKYTWAEQELLELSFVTVPANPSALTPAQKSLLTNVEELFKLKAKELEDEKSDDEPAAGDDKPTDEGDNKPDGEAEGEEAPADDDAAENEDGGDESEEKYIQMTEEQLKSIIEDTVAETLKQYQTISKAIKEDDEHEDDASVTKAEKILEAVKGLQSVLRGGDKEIGLTLRSLNDFLQTSKKES